MTSLAVLLYWFGGGDALLAFPFRVRAACAHITILPIRRLKRWKVLSGCLH